MKPLGLGIFRRKREACRRQVTGTLTRPTVPRKRTTLYGELLTRSCLSPKRTTLSSSTNHTLSMFATALRPALHLSASTTLPHLQMLMDPTNWFNNDMLDAETVTSTLHAGFEAEEGLFHLAHAKDVAPPRLRPPGNRRCRARGKACSTIPSTFACWMRRGIPVRSSLSTLPRAKCRRQSALSVLSFPPAGVTALERKLFPACVPKPNLPRVEGLAASR
jgi:hypothetical protein